jgi:hypothetical protein
MGDRGTLSISAAAYTMLTAMSPDLPIGAHRFRNGQEGLTVPPGEKRDTAPILDFPRAFNRAAHRKREERP